MGRSKQQRKRQAAPLKFRIVGPNEPMLKAAETTRASVPRDSRNDPHSANGEYGRELKWTLASGPDKLPCSPHSFQRKRNEGSLRPGQAGNVT